MNQHLSMPNDVTSMMMHNTIEDFGINNNNNIQIEVGSQIHETQLTDSDVLSGRGNGVAGHEGNKFYTRLIKENQEEYQSNSNGKKKKQIALSIIDIIKGQDPPGRFLKSKRNESFMWIVQDDGFAMKKVTQALRERPKVRKKGGQQEEETIRQYNILNSSRKRGNYDRSQPHLVDGPAKKSIVGSSRRIMAKWMTSMSKLNLINTSLGDIEIDDLETPVKEVVDDAMNLLSGQQFSGNPELASTFENNLQNMGDRLDLLLSQAMPSASKGLTDNSDDLGEFSQDFIELMATSARSLVENNRNEPNGQNDSSVSYEAVKKEMSQAVQEEINLLRQEIGQGPKCVSSKSLLTGNISLMAGNMDDDDIEEEEEDETDEIVDEELRNVLLQLATDSIQCSMGKLDISSRQLNA